MSKQLIWQGELSDLDATYRLATTLAAVLEAGDVVALHGTLGAGKTELARALIRARLGDPDLEVPSPTFNLVLTYETSEDILYHFDVYRLEVPEEAYELGIEEAFYEGISIIEWPEKLAGLLPPNHLLVTLTLEGATRLVRVEGDYSWNNKLLGKL